MNCDTQLFKNITEEINVNHIKQGLSYFDTLHRYSGSEDGEKAAQYLFDRLSEYGIDVRLLSYDLYRSLPLTSEVVIEGKTFPVTPYVFSGQCKDLTAPLYFDSLSEEMVVPVYAPHRCDGMAQCIVITYENSYDFAVKALQAGALAVLTVWPLQYAHHGTLGSVWGNPEPRDLLLHYPDIPFAEILSSDAGELIEKLKQGESISAALTVQMDTRVVKSQMPIGFIKGKSDEFILLSCHYDSWYQGMTDNAAANIAVLELARILQRHQAKLNRSVMVAFWSGHSDGRYAGSTWFYDNHWQDLKDRCVAHVNMDIAGCIGSDSVQMYASCIESDQFLDDVFTDAGLNPVTAKPMPRFADQTFFGPDVPLSFFPVYTDTKKENGMSFPWWHTKEDTLDKVDLNVLLRDTHVIARILSGLVSEDALPIDNLKFITLMLDELSRIQEGLNPDFDLSPIQKRLEILKNLYQAYQAENDDSETAHRRTMITAGTLTRITYTSCSPYNQDPALNQSPFASFQMAVKLSPESCPAPYYLAVKTLFLRQRNRLLDEIEKLISLYTINK